MRSVDVRKPLSLSILIIVAIVPCVSAAFSADELTLGQVAKASKVYFRDSAEFPMHIGVELTATDLAGKVRKHKTGKFKYDFHGYNQRAGHGTITLHGPRGMMARAALSAAASSMAPISFLSPDAETGYLFTVIDQGTDIASARLSRIDQCAPSTWLPDYDGLDTMCGSFAVQLEKDDLALKRCIFDAGNLPVSAAIDVLGPATVSGYHAEAEFQKVFLPDDPKPFLVPKLVTVTITTDKGKLVISSAYTTDPPRRK
jgi:hypothetical protein